MSELGSSGRGSARDRRERYRALMINRNTGALRGPSRNPTFQANNGATFRRTGNGRYRAEYDLPF